MEIYSVIIQLHTLDYKRRNSNIIFILQKASAETDAAKKDNCLTVYLTDQEQAVLKDAAEVQSPLFVCQPKIGLEFIQHSKRSGRSVVN